MKFTLTSSADGDLQFDFIFASEEYPEFLGGDLKNDAVAVFVNNTNRLLVGTDEVSVNTVNSVTNNTYFLKNDPDATGDFDSPLPYDGFTSNSTHPWLTTASVSITNEVAVTVKIVIADEEDSAFDSVVFLRPHMEISECQ